jgi:hypothetical protein
LFGDQGDPPPTRLRELVCGARVLNALAAPESSVHRGLVALGPAELYSLDPRPRVGVSCHVTEQWRMQLEGQGLPVPGCVPVGPHLAVPAELRRRGRELLGLCPGGAGRTPSPEPERGAGNDIVLIHPGSGGRGKCWPLPCFMQVARQLGDRARLCDRHQNATRQRARLPRALACAARSDRRRRFAHGDIGSYAADDRKQAVVFLIGPVERETWAPSELAGLRDEFRVLCCPEPDELVALLAAAAVVVGNDGGPGHLAALLGRPTVTIFGPTSPTVWRPLGPDSQVLVGDPEAHPYDWGITPGKVAALIARWL